jgi:hypothetical protein
MCSDELYWKKLNEAAVIFLGYSYTRRCSFSRAIFSLLKVSGDPSFFDPKCQNIWKNHEFFHQKIMLSTFFPWYNICVKTKNIRIERAEDALSFGKVSAISFLEIMNQIYNILKSTKNAYFVKLFITTYVIIQQRMVRST